MEKSQRKLSMEEAESLMPDGDWVHVFIDNGHPEGEQWSRKRVIERFKNVGVELGEQNAILHQHGLVSVGENTVFVQMRREKK